MPKSRKRKRGSASKSTQNAPTTTNSSVKTTATGRTNTNNRPLSPGVRRPQSLVWPVMVALGCWGMAFSFFVFSNDPNHVLFAGIAVLMALMWTFSVVVRIRKLLLLRQR
ncbi:MAG: hypothetical protein E6I80_08965 [Chloroflexi bacterium]|nr:MAG: hypothetical protein E6I80_08965 [Chloroflexota bacterium]